MGMYNHENQNLGLAKNFYETSLAEGFDNPSLFYNYSMIAYQEQDYPKAVKYIDKAIKGYSEGYLLADSYSLKGAILENAGEQQNAKQQYEKGLSIVPWHPGNFVSLASLLRKEGQAKEYATVVKKYIALDYSNSYLFNVYIDFLEKQRINSIDLEIERYLLSLEKRSAKETGALYFNLGRFAEMDGRKEAALKRYRIALSAFRTLTKAPEGSIEALEALISVLEKDGISVKDSK